MTQPNESAATRNADDDDELARQIIEASTSVTSLAFAGYGLAAIFLASWIPAIYTMARWACLALLVIVPAACLLWYRRCRHIEKSDPLTATTDPGWPDYASAKRTAARTLIIWGIVLIAWAAQPLARGWIAIQTLPSKPDTLVALRDRGGEYWVIVADSVERKSLGGITVRAGALVAHAHGNASAKEVVDETIERWNSLLARSPGYAGAFGLVGQSWQSRQTAEGGRVIEVIGDVSFTREPVLIDVAEVVLTRER